MAPLVQRVQRCLNGCRFFNSRSTVVVAVSTGVDSMTLLTALEKLLAADRIVVAHVNHHLRKQSQVEEEYLRKYCQARGLKLMVDQWQTHPRHGIEAAARDERYRFFKQVLNATGAQILMLAHQRDELVETMMMQALRGGRIDQLLGIPEKRLFNDGHAEILRPWLGVGKEQLIDFAKQERVTWYEDASNQEDETLRNRFRHHYLPEMTRENPRFEDHCLQYRDQLADLLAVKDDYLSLIWPRLFSDGQLQLKDWWKLSDATQRAVLTKWLNQAGFFDMTADMLIELQHWLINREKPSGQLKIGPETVLLKNYYLAVIKNVHDLPANHGTNAETVVKFDQWKRLNTDGECLISQQDKVKTLTPIAEMWLHSDQLPLKWRPVRAHDYIRLKDGGHQSVRRLLINQKLAKSLRSQVMVLADAKGEVLWVPFLKTSWLDRRLFASQPAVVIYLYQRKRIQK